MPAHAAGSGWRRAGRSAGDWLYHAARWVQARGDDKAAFTDVVPI
jgi:hypothetical protein